MTESPEWEASKHSFEAKRQSEYQDPCQEAANRSHRCLQRNNFDKSFCSDYFQAYRDCKKQWVTERRAAKYKKSE